MLLLKEDHHPRLVSAGVKIPSAEIKELFLNPKFLAEAEYCILIPAAATSD